MRARLAASQSHEGLAEWGRKWSAWLAGKSGNDLWPLHSAAQWVLGRSGTLGKLLHKAGGDCGAAECGEVDAGECAAGAAGIDYVGYCGDDAGLGGCGGDVCDDVGEAQEVPVVLVDTAGIRETSDVIERESIYGTHQQAGIADVVLLVIDGAAALPAEALAFLRGRGSAGGGGCEQDGCGAAGCGATAARVAAGG